MSLVLALLGAPTAQASAYYFSDIGIRSFSRGGAFVASADDLTALYYNPAALTRSTHGEAMVNLAGVSQQLVFDRTDYPGEGPGGTDLINETVENGAPPFPIPHLAVSHHFGLPNTTFAFGIYPPYAPDYMYPADGPQRYTLIDTKVLQVPIGPTVAHRIQTEKLWISLGLGVSSNYLLADQQLKVTLSMDPDTEVPDYDVDFRAELEDISQFSWNVGLLIEPPTGRFALGLQYQPTITFDAQGRLEANFEDNYYYQQGFIENPVATDESVSSIITMPSLLRGGLMIQPTEDLELELTGVWQGWGVVKDIVVTNMDMVVEMAEDNAFGLEDTLIEDDVTLPASYQNSWSVRLGGEYVLSDAWAVRAGGLYETTAIPQSEVGVGLLDTDKWGYGAGFGWRGERLDVDVGISQSFYEDLDINNSALYQIAVDPITGEVNEGRVIGDGTIESRLDLYGVGVTYRFGKERGA